MKITYKRTERGFLRVLFTDRYGEACSLQESSLASEPAIWLGLDGPAGQRMHLTQEQVRELLPLLTRFAGTGMLDSLADPETLLAPSDGSDDSADFERGLARAHARMRGGDADPQ